MATTCVGLAQFRFYKVVRFFRKSFRSDGLGFAWAIVLVRFVSILHFPFPTDDFVSLQSVLSHF